MKKDAKPDSLEQELRQLRLGDPDPELRRRTLLAAREALHASVPARETRPVGKGWWPELALAAAALLLLFVFPPKHPAVSAPGGVAPAVSAPAELRAALGIDPELARYINARTVPAGLGPASTTFRSLHRDPS